MKSFPSFEPPAGIIVSTKPRLAEVLSFATGQRLGGAERVNKLLGDDAPTAFKFTLFSEEFIQLQLTTALALTLPIAIGEFDTKYGTFSKKETIENCVTALGKLNEHCKTFGNPSTLSAEIAKLAIGERPTALYSRIVWLATKIANTSQTFGISLATLLTTLPQIEDPVARYNVIKGILTSPTGLITKAKLMVTETESLRNAIFAYKEEMSKAKTPLDAYFGKSSEIYTEAVEKTKDLQTKVQGARDALVQARDDYVKYCAAAAGSSIGIFVITCGVGWPLSAVAGGVLGALAEEARKRANEIEGEIEKLGTQVKQKAQLVSDVQGMSIAFAPLVAQLSTVYDGLGTIAGVWNNTVTQFQGIVNDTSPEDLKNYDAYTAATQMEIGQKTWEKIAKTTELFTARAFVDFKPKTATA